jgi:hypothetical protein
MSKINDGGTAFPYGQKNVTERYSEGLSMRDYFAAAALQGFCSQFQHYSTPTKHLAGWAYEQADAMIAARKEGA